MMGGSYPSWRWTPPTDDPVPDRSDENPTPTEDRLRRDYANLRLDCADLEELLGSLPSDLTAKDLKRLDKAVTVMKVGFKIVAKVLRKHGFDTSKSASSAETLKDGSVDESAVAESQTPNPSLRTITSQGGTR
jgi:hypothetical protein